jgi:DNA-binding NtrC family response regulator
MEEDKLRARVSGQPGPRVALFRPSEWSYRHAGMAGQNPLSQSTFPGAPASRAQDPAFSLTVVHPRPLAGQMIMLAPELVIGREPGPRGAELIHPTVSRAHAQIHLMIGVVPCVADLGSRNGTTVNGQNSKLPLGLAPQSVVRFGDVLLISDEPSARTFESDPVLPGRNVKMGRLRHALNAAGAGRAPVLVLGETGTGKERVAHEIHRLSGRAGPFLTLNCAELSPQLVESELFGHERGSFTGATTAKPGLFVAADGGTVFLDEVGELPLDLQPKLLRALEQGEVRPVGSVSAKRVDVRVVAATNRDLRSLVDRDEYRRDLYARLAFFELRLPPLRERRQDILSWVDKFVASYNAEHRSNVVLEFSPDAAERILLHSWPENLRGVSRLVHRLVSRSPTRPVGLTTLLEAMPELADAPGTPARSELELGQADDPRRTEPPPRPSGGALPRTSAPRPSREELVATYEASGRSVRATSKVLGKDRRQIYRWLKSYGIDRVDEDD